MKPSPQSPLILIGMPGAGKSYWAQRLAAGWGGSAVDLDAEIARISGKPIPEIFATKGEAGFRKWESKALQQLLADDQYQFIATGGGTPCFGDNLARLLEKGMVIYLEAPVALLAQRIAAQKTARPLLQNQSPETLLQKLSQLLAEREPFYRQAHHTLAAEGLSEATFARL